MEDWQIYLMFGLLFGIYSNQKTAFKNIYFAYIGRWARLVMAITAIVLFINAFLLLP